MWISLFRFFLLLFFPWTIPHGGQHRHQDYEDGEDPHGWVVASTSFRPTLAAVFPAWNPEISLGQSAPCQSAPGQIFVLFGSRPTRGSQPASLRFPHGSNPRAMRLGGFPRASPRRVATSRARAALPLLTQELQVARPPLWHPAVAVEWHLVAASPPPSYRFGSRQW